MEQWTLISVLLSMYVFVWYMKIAQSHSVHVANTSDNITVNRIWHFSTFSVIVYKYPVCYGLKNSSFVLLPLKVERFMAWLIFV